MTQIELKLGQQPTREDYMIVAQALADLHKPIVSALNRNKCVQAWLGYADVLFLGLGKHVLSPVQKRIETSYAAL
jgi:hypothetical protein